MEGFLVSNIVCHLCILFLLQFWAFEYLDVNRPKHKEGDFFPRARRWICPQDYCKNDSAQLIGPHFIGLRCQLNYIEESQVGDLNHFSSRYLLLVYRFSNFTFYVQVTWQPYLASQKYGSDAVQYAIDLAKMRIRFQSIYTWEYYLGERCRRQLGFPCQVPNHPPREMYGTEEGCSGNRISAEILVEEDREYASWFATNSIGITLDVNRFLGGPDIAGRVLDQWRVGSST